MTGLRIWQSTRRKRRPKLLWARAANPSAWRTTRWVLQLHDWFIYRLSGVVASEPSSAAMSQMLDISQGRWADTLLGALGILLVAYWGLPSSAYARRN